MPLETNDAYMVRNINQNKYHKSKINKNIDQNKYAESLDNIVTLLNTNSTFFCGRKLELTNYVW